VKASMAFFEWPLPAILDSPSYITGLAIIAGLAVLLVHVPMKHAGDPNEPAPPQALM
jgi:hypothetical protein